MKFSYFILMMVSVGFIGSIGWSFFSLWEGLTDRQIMQSISTDLFVIINGILYLIFRGWEEKEKVKLNESHKN